MTIKKLLEKIEEGKKNGTLTDKSEVTLGLPSEFYKDCRGSGKTKLEAGSSTTLPLRYVCIMDGYPEEDDIPNHLELIPANTVMLGFYRHNNILDCENIQ